MITCSTSSGTRCRYRTETPPEMVLVEWKLIFGLFQAFCSSLSGTLATQAALKGVGVGNQEATVAAATVTWLLRGQNHK